METITTEFHSHKDYRRVPKSEMEKRRRDRINNSLETLRLLMLENTCNEKLNNPKVEKAEILESVVDFLKIAVESYSAKRKRPRGFPEADLSPPCKQQPYSEGMRSCLLRVGEFISTKSQQIQNDDDDSATGSSREGSPRQLAPIRYQATSAHLHDALTTTSVGDLTLSTLLAARQPASPERLYHHEDRDTIKRFSSEPKCVTFDPVWRPWPQ